MKYKAKIKKGDTVVVLTGKDRGKTGTVMRVLPQQQRAVVEGVNIAKKHQKPTRANSKGQIVSVPMPIHISNIAIADPKTKKPTRIRIDRSDGKRTRIAVKSGSAIK